MPFNFRVVALCISMALGLSACDQSPAPKAGGGKGGEKVHLVEVADAIKQPLHHEVVRTGTLAARKSVRIFNQEEGRIDKLTVREGDRVEAGQVIVEMDRRVLNAELEKILATIKQAERDVARTRELWQRKVATKERLDNAETTLRVAEAEERLIRTRLDYLEIRAPFDGIVTERLVEPGDVAQRYSHLLTLTDPQSLYTKVSVSELMLPGLRKGAPVEVRIDALGDTSWPAQIARIHPAIDPRTRQGIVEVDLTPVPDGALAGQLCRVTLRTPKIERLVMPFAAMRHDREGSYVFAVVDGKAAIRRVRTGLRMDDRVEVLEGLADGDKVVVRGFLDLTPGKAVKIVTPKGQMSKAGSDGEKR